MCGIFSILNSCDLDKAVIEKCFEKGKRRGPESSILDMTSFLKMTMGFHRLAINGLNPESNQPLCIKDIVLICNGEIFNYKVLYKLLDVEPETGSD